MTAFRSNGTAQLLVLDAQYPYLKSNPALNGSFLAFAIAGDFSYALAADSQSIYPLSGGNRQTIFGRDEARESISEVRARFHSWKFGRKVESVKRSEEVKTNLKYIMVIE